MATELSVDRICREIYSIRGHRVMLDSSLAALYEVETGELKRAVRRNINRFPSDFAFELTRDECSKLGREFGISSPKKEIIHGGARYAPFGFTEQGVAMLSSVLNSDRAAEVNIAIMRTFVQLRLGVERPGIRDRLESFERRLMRFEEKLDQVLVQLQPSSKDGLDQINQNAQGFPIVNELRSIIGMIQRVVAKYCGLSLQDLGTPTREQRIVLPRQIAMYLMRKHTHIGFKEIGKCFSGKDHTTAMHAYRKIEAALDVNQAISEAVLAIETLLGAEVTAAN